MYKGFKIIDADAHMQPPGDIWDRYTEAEFYDRRPLVHLWENKMFHHFAPCELFPEGTGPGRAGGGGGRKGKVLRPAKVTESMHAKWGEAWEADFNVESRLKDMDTPRVGQDGLHPRREPATAAHGAGPGADGGIGPLVEQLGA